MSEKEDQGKHYRFAYKGINLDPFRIATIYNMKSFAMMTILKKCLCAGNRGHKDYKQDLKDIICAAERELELLEEDEIALQEPMFADIRFTNSVSMQVGDKIELQNAHLAKSIPWPEPVGAKIDYETRD